MFTILTIANNSNHTCNLILAGSNYAGSNEEEFRKINALENEGEKIRYKVVLTLCVLNKDLYDYCSVIKSQSFNKLLKQ